MSADRRLRRFTVESSQDGGAVLVLEDDTGAVHRFSADEEQLDVLADLIDDALGTAEPS